MLRGSSSPLCGIKCAVRPISVLITDSIHLYDSLPTGILTSCLCTFTPLYIHSTTYTVVLPVGGVVKVVCWWTIRSPVPLFFIYTTFSSFAMIVNHFSDEMSMQSKCIIQNLRTTVVVGLWAFDMCRIFGFAWSRAQIRQRKINGKLLLDFLLFQAYSTILPFLQPLSTLLTGS